MFTILCTQIAVRSEGRGAQRREDQDLSARGTALLDVDRRQHPRLSGHLQADVDQQAGVRGAWGQGAAR